MGKKLIIYVVLLSFIFITCSTSLFVSRPLNYTLLEQTIAAIEKLVKENDVTKIALTKFTNENGNYDRYSEQFYDELYLRFKNRYGAQFKIVDKEQMLAKLDAANRNALTAYEITSLFDKIEGLDGICTGFIGRNSYYLTLFTPKKMYDRDSERDRYTDRDWQVEVSNLLKKMIAKVDPGKIQPVTISAFDDFADNSSTSLGSFLSYKVYTELHKTYQLNINHRSDLPKILNEFALSQAGFIKPEDALEVGKLTGAKTILLGKTSGNMNKSWYLNLSLIDLQSGQTIWTDDYTKIGSDFFDTFDIKGIDHLDFSNLSEFNKKVILELIHSSDERSSLVALKQSMIYLIFENAFQQTNAFNFSKSVVDSLLSYQRYRMFEIDSIYIEKLKRLKEVSGTQ